MSKKIRITRSTFAFTAFIGSLLITAAVIATTLWSSGKTMTATDEAVSEVSSFYLEAMADRRAKTITNLINNNFDQMEKAVLFIEEEDIRSQEDLRAVIGKIKSLLALNRFALVDEDNIVYTQYTTYTGGSRHAFLSEDKMDERSISTVFLYGSSKQLCLAVPTPELSVLGKQFKACFVQIDIREIVDLLAFDDEGRTHFGLYSPNGETLSDTELGPYIGKHNLFDALETVIPADVLQENRDHFANGAEGSISFDADGYDETLCYVPIEGPDWEMVVLICGSFKHGAVYRVGGDEFTVILQDSALEGMSEDILQFNRQVEKNIGTGDVVVSAGYSVLTGEDRQLSDVFERADRMMYERKKELKEMGAKSRSDS